ncbi:MAG: PLP-dependent aminotransferase family protein [Clostridiales Family XIII bacterium]|jgi:2-aminoadipate transaminase|nr:PLP-dependent aminotransferase family protein [Clostridiales Family XIII bacterium]
MKYKYATRMEQAKPSIIRELLKLSADPSIISFAGGNPDADTFPVGALSIAGTAVLHDDGKSALQYSVTEGNEGLRRALIQRMAKLGVPAGLENVCIISGSQQGLDLTGKIFVDKGDAVIIEAPSYMGAINAFRYYEPEFIEVDMDEDGMRMDILEQKLKENPNAKFIYTIPDFQNPTGRTMSLLRRKRLVALAEEYNVAVVEDSPYYDLRFRGESVPPLKHFDKTGSVIYLGSFSKILCPAYRVGWVVATPEIVRNYVVLKQAADLHTNEPGQRQIAEYLRTQDIEAHIAELNASYLEKLDLMIRIIKDEFPAGITYTIPDGGLFVWLELPTGNDAQELFQVAMDEAKVAFVPGDTFYPYGGHPDTLRLSYATMSAENIENGMTRLAAVFRKHIK